MNAARPLEGDALACPICHNQSIVPPNSLTLKRGQFVGRVTFACGYSATVARKMSGARFTQIVACRTARVRLVDADAPKTEGAL